MEVVRLFNVKKTKEYEKMVLENNVQKILFRQLDNFWDGWNKEVISIKISQALGGNARELFNVSINKAI